ncbi:CBS domain-containing protein [Bermanella sp. WJH001]|uniref:CBS domain-containing protein n=1 Tax=Bermanella sp. WJH001 TaxID=3048005 RepID=UPI0024BE7599|nr:CBS domain-containing protein [Bermanella sp. WJH001]MDJ1537983.1 CBS domain-containing protein [Bermanella sp. WJH001]
MNNTALLTAKEIMTKDVLMAYEGWSVKRLSTFFIKNKISGAPVIASDHSLVGVVTATDLVNFEGKSDTEKSQILKDIYDEFVGMNYDEKTMLSLSAKADENCTVNKVMTPKVVQIDEDTLIVDVAKTMLESGIRRIFVTKNGIMSGVISTNNMLKVVSQLS